MQIRQKASAMTGKKPVIFKQTLPSRFISFSKIQKNYHIHTKTIKPVILFHKNNLSAHRPEIRTRHKKDKNAVGRLPDDRTRHEPDTGYSMSSMLTSLNSLTKSRIRVR